MNKYKLRKPLIEEDTSLKDDIKKYMDSFKLTETYSQRILYNVKKQKNKSPKKVIKTFTTVVAAFSCLLLIIIFTNSTSNGKVAAFIKELCKLEKNPESVQILKNMTPEMKIYAPVLISCNENHIIFANSRGLAIYNRKEQRVTSTIDLQKINCNFFETDTMSTKFIVDIDKLIIFNTKDEKVNGDCYIYDLKNILSFEKIICLEPSESIKAENDLLLQWEDKMNKNYTKTFEQIDPYSMIAWESSKENIKYSEKSFIWTSQDNITYSSCLIMQNDVLHLYSINQATKNPTTERLKIDISKEALNQNKNENRLPQYVYSGDDMIIKSICDYIIINEKGKYADTENDMSLIPTPVIYDIVYENDIIKVFGIFYSDVYYKNGDTLENACGEARHGCFNLKKENETYTIISVEEAIDGSLYISSLKDICKNHPNIYEKFLNTDPNEQYTKNRKVLLEQYITENNLDIKYYHDFGWDPVKLFADN